MTHCFSIVGDPERNKTVELQLQNRTVRLTFTDQPVPPPAAPKAKSNTTLAQSVLNALRRKVLGDHDDEEEDADAEPAAPAPSPAKAPAPAKAVR
jgi:hypothetical protein